MAKIEWDKDFITDENEFITIQVDENATSMFIADGGIPDVL